MTMGAQVAQRLYNMCLWGWKSLNSLLYIKQKAQNGHKNKRFNPTNISFMQHFLDNKLGKIFWNKRSCIKICFSYMTWKSTFQIKIIILLTNVSICTHISS